MKLRRYLVLPASILLTASLLLSGCVGTRHKERPLSDWQTRQEQLAAITNWQMHARIGFRGRQNNGSASLIWIETAEQRNLRLLGPLGGGLIKLQQDATGVSIQDSKGDTWHADNAGQLIYRVTGWQIPVSGLRWWILGLTEPGSDAVTDYDDRHRLIAIQQAGWQVSLSRYTLFAEYELPTLIIMENLVDPEDERYIRIKTIIKDWKITQ